MSENRANRAQRRVRDKKPANADVQPTVDNVGDGWREGTSNTATPKVEKNKKLTVRVTDEDFRQFKVAIATAGESVQSVLEKAVRDYLSRNAPDDEVEGRP